MSFTEIELLSETTKDEVVKMQLMYQNRSLKVSSDGNTTKLSMEMTEQLIDFIKAIPKENLNYGASTTIELRVKHIQD